MKPRILLIEDEAPIRNSTARLLRAEGYDVSLAEDGARGFMLASENIPDLVVSDIMMPELDGFGLLERLRANESTKHLPVLLLSALDDRGNMRKGMTLGADDYLPKPFTREELLQAVTALLKKSDVLREQTERVQRETEESIRRELTGKFTALPETSAISNPLRSAPPEVRQYEGAVLTLEVRDFARLSSRLSADEVSAMLSKLLTEACVPIIEAGGRVARFMGEGLVAVFDGVREGDQNSFDPVSTIPISQPARKPVDEVAQAVSAANAAAIAAALGLALVCAQFRIWTRVRFDARNLPDFLVCMGVSSGRITEHFITGSDQVTLSGEAYHEALAAGDAAKAAQWTIAATRQVVRDCSIKPRLGRSTLAATPASNGTQMTGQHISVLEVLGAEGDAPMATTLPQQRLADIEKAVRENAEMTAKAAKQALSTSLTAVVNSAGKPVEVRGYRVHGELGKGSMAHVYRATQEADGTEVVLKIMHVKGNESSTYIKRFIQEYSLLSRLSNANVVRIYDQGFTDEHIFITMEYLPGGSLDERITRGISTQAAARYTKALANGLAGVHAQGVVHRDLKPRNILFRNTDTPVITDFGVAKDLQNPLNETQAGEIFGTPYYLSPEQARSENQFVESSADIYSLGVMFYELLTGQRPFTADRLEALLKMHMVNDPPPMIGPARSFEHIIAQMMAKSPTNRPTALQVAMEIDEVLERM